MCTIISGEFYDSIFWVDLQLVREHCLTGCPSSSYLDILEAVVPAFSVADNITSHRRGLVLIGHLRFTVPNWEI
jgi:hypothetical protein